MTFSKRRKSWPRSLGDPPVRVFAPGSIGNLGPGFDVLGVAVEGIGDVVEARVVATPGVRIARITGRDAENIPKEAEKNSAAIAAARVIETVRGPGSDFGLELAVEKRLPSGAGLGSSAASAVAGAYAANVCLGEPLKREELLLPSTRGEAAVSGGFFADNTAPSLFGGATLTRSSEPLDVIPLGTIPGLLFVIVTPNLQILTREARAVLPKMIPMESFVANMANACLIAAAFARGDAELLARCVDDAVVEPARAPLIPGFYAVKRAAQQAGALGCSISGAGSSVFAVALSRPEAERIGKAMQEAFRREGRLDSEMRISAICEKGAQLLDDTFFGKEQKSAGASD